MKKLICIFYLVLCVGQLFAQQTELVGQHSINALSDFGGKSYLFTQGVTIKGSSNFSRNATANGAFFIRPATAVTKPQNIPPNQNKNYVRTEAILERGVFNEGSIENLTIHQKNTNFEYLDGIGRKLQTVNVQASPAQRDLINAVKYDVFGRVSNEYLPFTLSQPKGAFYEGFYPDPSTSAQRDFYRYPSVGIPYENDRPFTEHGFELSSLNREIQTYGPGNDWKANNKFSSTYSKVDASGIVYWWQYNSESVTPSLMIYNNPLGYYPSGTLQYSETKDEAEHIIRVYTDVQGHTVLKEVQQAANWLRTYFIYDDLGNLCVILPPEASAAISDYLNAPDNTTKQNFLNKWAFQYVYDNNQRLIKKRLPGTTGFVLYAYDQWDRQVLSQDPVQRVTNEWSFTKYDIFNRPVITGVYTTSRAYNDLVNDVQNFSGRYESPPTSTRDYTLNGTFPTSTDQGISDGNLRTVTYYDNYDFLTYSGWDATRAEDDYSYLAETGFPPASKKIAQVKGQTTGSKTKNLGTLQWLHTVVYYDNKYRTLQAVGDNHLGGLDRTLHDTDFAGRQRKAKLVHTGIENLTVLKEFSYDHGGRLLTVTQTTGSTSPVILVSNKYNELGQLIEKNLHSSDGGNSFLQSIDYRYNIRGQLTSINNSTLSNDGSVNNDANDLFGADLLYQQQENINGGTTTPLFNGNISAIRWSTNNLKETPFQRIYGFSYDDLSRLSVATYAAKTGSGWTGDVNMFNESASYDRQGNIQNLSRNSRIAGSLQTIDNLGYVYDGNKLLRVTDGSDYYDPGNTDNGYTEISHDPVTEYTYDANGRMTGDLNKGIQSISYNTLNMPEVIQLENNRRIEYTYDAVGNKLSMKAKQTISGTTYTLFSEDYTGNIHFQDGRLSFVLTDEGRVVKTNSGFEYEYFLKDHQSNTRVVFGYLKETQEHKATMEDGNATVKNYEEQAFSNISISNRSGLYNHTPPSAQMPVTNKSVETNGFLSKAVGPGKMLLVKNGDRVKIEVFARHTTPVSSNAVVTNLVVAATAALGIPNAGETQTAYQAFNGNLPGVSSLIPRQANAPKAYLFYIIFNNNYVYQQFGYAPVTGAAMVAHEKLTLDVTVPVDGFLYAYVANESNVSSTTSVFFDDLLIVHEKNQLTLQVVQTSDYYPFGLSFNQRTTSRIPANTSSAATGKFRPNAYLFQGQELQSDFNLGWYQFKYRMHDPATGRFSAVDPLAEKYEYNSPYAFSENRLIDGIELEGAEVYLPYASRFDYGHDPMSWGGKYLGNVGVSFYNGFAGLWNYTAKLDEIAINDGTYLTFFNEKANGKLLDDINTASVRANFYWSNIETPGMVANAFTKIETYETLGSLAIPIGGLNKLGGMTKGVSFVDNAATVGMRLAAPEIALSGAAKGGGSLLSLTEETFSQALFRGVENVGGYSVYGTKGLVGNTFNRNIFLLEASGGKSLSGFRSFIGSIEAEALGAGANKISIYGSSVINKGFLNPNIATRFGYSFEQSGSGVFLQKALK